MSHAFERGNRLFNLGRYDLAAEGYREHVADYPDDPAGHAMLGLCRQRQGKMAEAMSEVREAIRLAPNWAYSHYAMGSILEPRGWLGRRRAGRSFAEAVRLDPASAENRYRLAISLYNDGKSRAALTAAEEGLALDPRHVGCLNARGLSLSHRARRAEASAAFRAALAIDPVSGKTFSNLAHWDLRRRDLAAAHDHYLEALRLNPMNPSARWGLGLTRIHLKPTLDFLSEGMRWRMVRIRRDGPADAPTLSVAPRWRIAVGAGLVAAAPTFLASGSSIGGGSIVLYAWTMLAVLHRRWEKGGRPGVATHLLVVGLIAAWIPFMLINGLRPAIPQLAPVTLKPAVAWAAGLTTLFATIWMMMFIGVASTPRDLADWAARRILEGRAARRRKRHRRGDG